MHDTIDIESRGVAAGFVATTEFQDAAEAQAQALGANPAGVFVRHPIQDRTEDEIRALADTAYKDIVTMVVDR